MAFDKEKFIAQFLSEAKEHLIKLNDDLLELEKNPDDKDTINRVFRSAHTIKGSSKMMKLNAISDVAHKLEDALDALRQKKIRHSQEISDLYFKGVDTISGMLEIVASGKEVQEGEYSICKELERVAQGQMHMPKTPESEDPAKRVTEHKVVAELDDLTHDIAVEKDPADESERRKSTRGSDTLRISENKLDGLIKLMGEVVSTHSRMRRRVYRIKEIEKLSKKNAEIISKLGTEAPPDKKDQEMMLHIADTLYSDVKNFISDIREEGNVFETLTGELQDRSLEMRMLPLSTIFNGFHRVVRDVARDFEKEVDFLVEGGDTELDKKIIEKIGDPLIHMVRNSVDHGIETPEERVKKGKPRRGIIRLSARYEGGSVFVELNDDGAGVSVQRIKERALKKRMFDEEALKSIPDTEILNLIFHPGFSTSDMITDISGRGVGMDVVKRNICDDLKGAIQVKTKEGRGTAFHIRLPLTMAIMHVLVVSISDMVFAIPSHFVKEVVRVREEDIINVVDKRAIRLREQIIPVADLNNILGLPSISGGNENGRLILIVAGGSERQGLIIDNLLQEEDRTIKPLPAHMKDIDLISGVTVSGSNEIDNVLNIPKIMEAAKEVKVAEYIKQHAHKDKQVINILVVDDSVSTREIEKSILESYGYRVSLAEDGMEALEYAMKTKFDLVVTDIEMPMLDGFSLTEKLKNDENYKDTPVILVSSRDKEEDKKRGLMVGADAYIVKGDFDQTNLLDAIQSLVG